MFLSGLVRAGLHLFGAIFAGQFIVETIGARSQTDDDKETAHDGEIFHKLDHLSLLGLSLELPETVEDQRGGDKSKKLRSRTFPSKSLL